MVSLKKFKVQENQYSRPYHHLINLDSKKTFDYVYWGLEYYGYVKFILNQISKFKKKKDIAEVGCGDGKISIEIAKNFKKSNVEGFDLAKQAIMFAKSYSYGINNCNFYDFDFKNTNKKFDLILAVEVLEHIPDLEIKNFISIISKNLKNDGFFLISVPTKNIPLNKKHYRHYDLDLLKTHLSEELEVQKYFFIHNENSLLYKFLRSFLINRFFITNSRFLKNKLFNIYEKYLLTAKPSTGAHLIAICKKY